MSKEIINYHPDLLIVLMGNNTGKYHEPVKLNYLIYKYKILSRFWTTRIITEMLNPPLNVTDLEADLCYKNDLKAIVLMAEKSKVSVVLCTLPKNFSQRIFLTDLVRGVKTDNYKIQETVNEFLPKEIIVRGDVGLNKYNNVARSISKEHANVILVDFEHKLLSLSHGKQSYDYFIDDVHYWNPVYSLLSDEIIENIYKYNLESGRHVFANLIAWRKESFCRTPVNSILKENFRDLKTIVSNVDLHYDALCRFSLPALCSYLYQRDSSGFISFSRTLLKDKKPSYKLLVIAGLVLCDNKKFTEGIRCLDKARLNKP